MVIGKITLKRLGLKQRINGHIQSKRRSRQKKPTECSKVFHIWASQTRGNFELDQEGKIRHDNDDGNIDFCQTRLVRICLKIEVTRSM